MIIETIIPFQLINVIDIETSNNMNFNSFKSLPDKYWEESEENIKENEHSIPHPILVGLSKGNKIIQIIHERNQSLKDFRQEVKTEIYKNYKEDSNIYAFFRKFDGYGLRKIGVNILIQEINEPFKWETKIKRFSRLESSNNIPKEFYSIVKDPIPSRECIALYKSYINFDNKEHLQKIIDHNINCIVKEHFIQINNELKNEWIKNI